MSSKGLSSHLKRIKMLLKGSSKPSKRLSNRSESINMPSKGSSSYLKPVKMLLKRLSTLLKGLSVPSERFVKLTKGFNRLAMYESVYLKEQGGCEETDIRPVCFV